MNERPADYVTAAREMARWQRALEQIEEEARRMGLAPEGMLMRALWGLDNWEPRT